MHCAFGKDMSGLATLYSIGNRVPMPGTFGSIFGLILGVPFLLFFHIYIFLLFVALVVIFAFFSVERYLQRKDVTEDDPKEVIIDEVLGQLISIIPIFLFSLNFDHLLIMCIISLILFRFFDILKPWPISFFDKIKNSFGVIFDDVAAGIFAALLLYLIYLFMF